MNLKRFLKGISCSKEFKKFSLAFFLYNYSNCSKSVKFYYKKKYKELINLVSKVNESSEDITSTLVNIITVLQYSTWLYTSSNENHNKINSVLSNIGFDISQPCNDLIFDIFPDFFRYCITLDDVLNDRVLRDKDGKLVKRYI